MNELTRYEKRLARALDCPKHLRHRLLGQTRQMAEDFTAGKPDASWDEVEQFLGDPQELAQTMLESLDQEELARYRKRKVWLKRSIAGFLVVAFVLVIFGYINFYMTRKEPLIVTVEESLTVIYPMEEQQ